MKKVIILGSTGSIGKNTIKVIQNLKGFKTVAIAGYKNYRLLINQARMLKPKTVGIINCRFYTALKNALPRTKIFCGEAGILEMIEGSQADILVSAFASSVGIHGILKAIEKRMRICLATKEILVSFGDIVMEKIKKYRTELLPVDSEHSAIYQCLEGRDKKDLKRVILTASGGPFLNRSLKNVTKKDVLKHPVWNMGSKITVDSATMMNKGLEVIEASHLFNLPLEKIDVLIHPEAIIHSMVQFKDGTYLAQLSVPDMKLPIQYALTAPKRYKSLVPDLNLTRIKKLTFFKPDLKRFPCLKFAYEALKIGKSMPAVLNAANESTVKFFLEDKVKFNEIPLIIRKIMNLHRPFKGGINDYIQAEQWAKEQVRRLL